MLVLSRKTGEKIRIGNNVDITIISIDKNQVKLSIDAPREITILRGELIEEIKKQNILASKYSDISQLKKIRLKK